MERFLDTYNTNGFVADSFVASYDEDRIYDYLGERVRDDNMVHVVSQEFAGEGFSRIGQLDLATDKIVLSNNIPGVPFYEIAPDYTPIEIMFANFDRFYNEGKDCAYDFVPVAEPIVPTNKLYDSDESKILDVVMISKGYKILDPSPGQSGMCDESNSDIYSEELQGKYFDRFNLKSLSPLAYSDNCQIVSMQFNPFVPASAKSIQDIQWIRSGTAVEGHYRHRGKVIAFEYDLKSRFFRYHSDIWMDKVGMPNSHRNFYQMFDLISVKRFFEEDVQPRDKGISPKYVGVMIEPLSTKRPGVLNYSLIGPWEGEIKRGIVGEDFFVPYLTPKMVVKGLTQDTTTERFKVVEKVRYFPDEIYDEEKSVRIKRIGNHIVSKDYYFRPNGRTGILLRRDGTGDRYMYECNFIIPTQFTNNNGSVIEHPLTVPVIDFFRDSNQILREQKMFGSEWGQVVDSDHHDLRFQKLDEIEEEETEELDLSEMTIFRVPDYANWARVYKQKMQTREVRQLNEDEKIEAAMRDHPVQYSYKKFKDKYYSGIVRGQELAKKLNDKRFLDAQQFN